jgi:hypothetical protein
VCRTFTYGNVAVIVLDGNDLSVEIPLNNGYTSGNQTRWLERNLAAYRADSRIDFIVCSFHNCMHTTNDDHDSDGGIRMIWEPLFDRYEVDLVVNGHNHAYERNYPIRDSRVTKEVQSGGTVNAQTDGTTYIVTGGGGVGLSTGWNATSDAGTTTTSPGDLDYAVLDVWSGSDSAKGGTGVFDAVQDPVQGASAYREAVWSCLQVVVTPPDARTRRTTMEIKALSPTQNSSQVISAVSPTVMDSVTISRVSAYRQNEERATGLILPRTHEFSLN